MKRTLASVLTGALITMGAVVGVAAPASAAEHHSLSGVTTAESPAGVEIAVSGSGYSDVVALPGQPEPSVYVAIVERGSFVADQAKSPAVSLSVGVGGSVEGTLEVPVAALDRSKSYDILSWPTRSFPSETNWFARGQVSIDWDAVFPPAQAVQTTTTLAAAPTGAAVEGETVVLTATVAPTAAGTVAFAADNESLGQTAVVDGVAEISTGTLDLGARTITASFTPADSAAFAPSASEALSYTVTAKPVAPTAQLSVSKSTGLNPEGETITVTGTGYEVNAGGIYAQLGWIVEGEWTPISQTETRSGNRASVKAALVGSGFRGQPEWTIASDGSGSFSWTTTVTKAEADAKKLEGGTLAVYTLGAHSNFVQPANERFVPLAFATPAPVADPKVTVTPSVDLDPAVENTITVTGTGFTQSAWVSIAPKSFWDGTSPRPLEGWITLTGAWPKADGSISATLKVAAGTLDPGVEYVVSTARLSDASDRSHDTFTPVSVKQPVPVAQPKVTVTPTADLDPSVTNVLTVSATGFFGPSAANGAYVLFGEKSTWNGQGALPSTGWIAQGHVASEKNGGVKDGAFTFELVVPAGKLDPAKEYVVVTSAAHELSIFDRSLDTFTAVTVAQPVKPTIGLSVGEVRAGEALTVSGYGFTAGDPVVVTVNSDPFTLGTATVAADGRFSVRGTIPASFATGPHTVTVAVNGVVLASQALTVTAAAATPAVEAPQAPSCVARSVSGASIQWGVKESFRSYITGTTAKGQISGGWGAGSGAYSTENDRGRVSFGGSMHYTGHDGLLDVTLSNPRIQVTGPSSASLILNVQSKGLGNEPDVNANGVVFATLSLPAASESADRISWNGAAATLTAAGAEAFAGFYNAGDALDAVSFAFPLGAEVPCDTTTDATLAATGGEAPVNTVWLGAGALLLGALAISIARRRRVEA